ncbi:MAG TPA: alpha/beta fold hydrolase [Vicinamibacteria bacterium]|jgi:pimeloyl-ACP methyl ester carboxylesterase|nr:alpha/beta fold hydrolase [Vicinamibacteria bacterium]
MKWLKRVGLVLVAALAIFIFGWAPYWLAGLATIRRFTYNDKENAGLTPKSFELPYEDVSFNAPDGVTLKGWWVPAPEARGTVVLVHGLNRSRIEMVKKVPFLHKQGWNALLFDLRHHGESGGSASSFGFFEKQDVHAATAFARTRAQGPVVLWGVSLGGASATLAAAEDPGVAALVCDSSYRSLRDTVSHHLRLFRGFRWWLRIVPNWPVANEVVYWIGRRARFDPDAVDVRGAAAHLAPRPCLFVCNSGDRRMPSEIAFELKAAAGPQAHVLVVPGTSHGGAYRDGTAAYETAVTELLGAAAAAPPVRTAYAR